jgi:hypothetical protein
MPANRMKTKILQQQKEFILLRKQQSQKINLPKDAQTKLEFTISGQPKLIINKK